MDIPKSAEDCVIVLPNNEALGFRFNCYRSDFLGGVIDKVFFNETVKNCNKVCEDVWRKKRVEEDME